MNDFEAVERWFREGDAIHKNLADSITAMRCVACSSEVAHLAGNDGPIPTLVHERHCALLLELDLRSI
jgi:hypothetical protein